MRGWVNHLQNYCKRNFNRKLWAKLGIDPTTSRVVTRVKAEIEGREQSITTSRPWMVATGLQGFKRPLFLSIATNSKLIWSVSIHQNNCPPAWLAYPRNGARLSKLNSTTIILPQIVRGNQGNFFAQSERFKLASPQAAWLSLFYNRKISSVEPPGGAWIKDTLLRDRERKKAQHPAGFEPMTSRVLLYNRCLGNQGNLLERAWLRNKIGRELTSATRG